MTVSVAEPGAGDDSLCGQLQCLNGGFCIVNAQQLGICKYVVLVHYITFREISLNICVILGRSRVTTLLERVLLLEKCTNLRILCSFLLLIIFLIVSLFCILL